MLIVYCKTLPKKLLMPKLYIFEAIDTGRESGIDADSTSDDTKCFGHYNNVIGRWFSHTAFSIQQEVQEMVELLAESKIVYRAQLLQRVGLWIFCFYVLFFFNQQVRRTGMNGGDSSFLDLFFYYK